MIANVCVYETGFGYFFFIFLAPLSEAYQLLSLEVQLGWMNLQLTI